MGFVYLGPVDGHDIAKMSYLLSRAKEEHCPVLLHVITTKGKGYQPAEETPSEYHGVGRFNPAVGLGGVSGEDFSSVFGQSIAGLAADDPHICAITAGMRSGTGLDVFALDYPSRFFDVGIAEGHAVSMAAGLAKQGMIPVFAVYSTFLQRAYDMILQDIALQQLHVVLCVDRAGLVGPDGETHHGVFDVGYLRQVPGMTIFAPSNYQELEQMLREAVLETGGPVAIRYPRGAEGAYRSVPRQDLIRQGSDVTIITYGITVNAALQAAERLEKRGVSAAVIKLRKLKPIATEEIFASAERTGHVLVVEEANEPGCVYEALAAFFLEQKSGVTVAACNLGDRYMAHGDAAVLRHEAGLDAEGIEKTALEVRKIEP